MKFRTILLLIAVYTLVIIGCGSGYDRYGGQLLGKLDRPNWAPVLPFGMVYVPSGTLHIGPSDQDVNHALVQRSKQVSIQGFYMDDTEITNNEYRQFVQWVKDSISHYYLDHFDEDFEGDWEKLDWSMEIDYSDVETQDMLEELYLPQSQWIGNRKEWEVGKFVYTYTWVDYRGASMNGRNGNPKDKERRDFIHNESVKIYPDTLVWVRDFTYSYNEPMARNYYSHPAFDDYPVVGIRWDQATAFNHWRTKFWEAHRRSRGEILMDPFRLPTEHEWEYAARGGRKLAQYPWGGPYVRNSKGCILANFKPGRGNYPEDGGFYSVRADAYWPNDYGLYNMAGNVSEWTSTAYYENSYSFIHDLNPDMRYDADRDEDSQTMHRKVIRGGSWKDVGYYIQSGTRHWEFADSSKSYVGFRCVTTMLGRDHHDK